MVKRSTFEAYRRERRGAKGRGPGDTSDVTAALRAARDSLRPKVRGRRERIAALKAELRDMQRELEQTEALLAERRAYLKRKVL